MSLSTLLGYDRQQIPFKWKEINIVSPFIHQFTLDSGDDAFYIKPTANKKLPDEIRNMSGYYKGLSAHIVILVFSRYFKEEVVEKSFNYLRKDYPDLCERLFSNLVILPTELTSHSRFIDRWYDKHQNCLLETKAWSDQCETVPDGYYLVRAALAGDRFIYEDRYFFVKKVEYLDQTKDGFPFICNPCFHEERVVIQKSSNEPHSKPKLALIINNKIS